MEVYLPSIVKIFKNFILMKYIYFFLNIIFFSKKIYSRPKQKKILIVNGDHAEVIKKYLKTSETNVVSNRFARGIEKDAEIYLFILFTILIKLKFSVKEYVRQFIKYSKPEVIITLIDNDIFFYELSSDFKGKSIAIQNSYRSTQLDIFAKIKDLKNRNLKCNYLLTFNKHVGEFYKKFLDSEVVQIGSFRSNSINKNMSKKNYDILYVSSYKGFDDNEFLIKEHNVTWGDHNIGEEIIFGHLKKFIKKNKNIRLFVLGCKITSKVKEQKYWNQKLNGINFTFIPQDKKRNTYKIIDETKVLISIDSSLGYESIARGNKICVFSVRPDKYPTNSSKFGWPSKLKDKGFFWTNSLEYSEFERVVKNTYLITEEKYFQSKTKDIIPDQIIFDENNKVFQKIVNEIS